MSFAPFDVRVIQERIRMLVPGLRLVGLAADYEAVRNLQDFPAPAAYVLLAAENGTSQPVGHAPRGEQVAMRQSVGATFAVAVAARNYRGTRGEAAADEIATILAQVRQVVVGFVPDVPGGRPCEFVNGQLKDHDAATVLWLDVYWTQHSIGN